MTKQLQDLAFDVPETGMPDLVEAYYDDALKRGGKKIWSGMLQVAASGFGKGVMLAAVAAVAVLAAFGGFNALAGNITVMGALGTSANATFAQGMEAGIGQSLAFLTSGVGAALLAVGGLVGIAHDVRKEQNKITAEMAKVEALEFERQRQQAREQELQKTAPVAAKTASVPVPGGFAANELQKRMQAKNSPCATIQ